MRDWPERLAAVAAELTNDNLQTLRRCNVELQIAETPETAAS